MFLFELFVEPVTFAIALLSTGAILFILVYFIITLSDLECDYLNPEQCCRILNKWVIPKMAIHTFVVVLLILNSQWLLTFLNLPLTIRMFYEYCNIPMGNVGLYDPMEIHNRGQLRKHNKDCLIYLGYYLIFFFIYLYCLIVALLKGDPINRNDDDILDF